MNVSADSLQRNQTKFDPAFDRFCAARYSQFGIQRREMEFYGMLTDPQFERDLFICQSLCHELDDFHLPGS